MFILSQVDLGSLNFLTLSLCLQKKFMFIISKFIFILQNFEFIFILDSLYLSLRVCIYFAEFVLFWIVCIYRSRVSIYSVGFVFIPAQFLYLLFRVFIYYLKFIFIILSLYLLFKEFVFIIQSFCLWFILLFTVYVYPLNANTNNEKQHHKYRNKINPLTNKDKLI